jgi:hypothetical protein
MTMTMNRQMSPPTYFLTIQTLPRTPVNREGKREGRKKRREEKGKGWEGGG